MSKATAVEIVRGVMVAPTRVFVDDKIRTRHAAPVGKKVEALAESIKTHGQESNIMLRPYDGPDTNDYEYTLVAGENRLAACKLLETDVRGDVYPIKEGDVVGAITLGYSENNDRNELTPLDHYHTFTLLAGQGLKGKAIAQRLNVQEAFVSKVKKFDGLSDKLKAMLGKGEINMNQALALLEIPDEGKREKLAAEGLTADKIKEIARRTPKDGKAKDQKTGKGSGKRGRKATETKQRSLPQVKAALEATVNADGKGPETRIPVGEVAQMLLEFIAGAPDMDVANLFAGLIEKYKGKGK